MVSIRKLEKVLRPFWIGGAAASAYHDYNEYEHGGIKVRVDNPEPLEISMGRYKTELEGAARKLGLIE